MLMMKWMKNLASVHHLSISKMFVHMGSELAYNCTHSPVKFVFIDPNVCMRSGVRIFQTKFGADPTVINEAPDIGIVREVVKVGACCFAAHSDNAL